MRRFVLVRHRDPSGVSGTGVIAEGVEFSDGSAMLRWHGTQPCTSVFDIGVGGILAVHGHAGATEVVYADPYPDPERVPTSSRSDRADGLCLTCGAAWPCTQCRDQSERPLS